MIDATTIELLVAPSVLIPAGALLAMSTSARLSSILARVRSLHQLRIEAYESDTEGRPRAEQVKRVRLSGLEKQAHQLIARAALTQTSLMLAYASVAMLLLSTSALGLSLIWASFELLAVVLFFLGLVLLTVSVVAAMLDVRQALRWVRYEHGRVASLDHQHTTPGNHEHSNP